MPNVVECEALIVGGGPAGSCAAANLALKGRRPVLLERERGARYHIGESLIPFCYYPLERIGFIEKLKRSHFPKKYSVVFVGTSGKPSRPFYFFQYLYDSAAVAWQVLRSEFDEMLLAHAGECGADLRRGVQVQELILEDGVVRGARGSDGTEYRAPITIDASGRDGLAMTQFGWRVMDPGLNRFAVWSYFQGHELDAGIDAGATIVASVPEGGWFWWIPLPNRVISCGVVARKDYLFRDAREPEAIFAREVAQNPWIASHLAPATRIDEFRVVNEYSYRSRHGARDGLLLAGDAFGFLDPLFSSGVFLALCSGERAALAADTALRSGDVSGARLSRYGEELASGVESVRRLVYAYYDTEFSFTRVMSRDPYARADISDILNGNFFRSYEEFYRLVGDLVKLPPQLTTGAAFTPAAPPHGAAAGGAHAAH
jgi:flavin-dependent dehydrogenase